MAAPTKTFEVQKVEKQKNHPFAAFTDYRRVSVSSILSVPTDQPSSSRPEDVPPPRPEPRIIELPSYEPPEFRFLAGSSEQTKLWRLDVRTWFLIHTVLFAILACLSVVIHYPDLGFFVSAPIIYTILLFLSHTFQKPVWFRVIRVLGWISLTISILATIIYPSFISHQRGFYHFWSKFKNIGQMPKFSYHITWTYSFQDTLDACCAGFLFTLPFIGIVALFASQLYLVQKVLRITEYQEQQEIISPRDRLLE